jgi:hypothetical protein
MQSSRADPWWQQRYYCSIVDIDNRYKKSGNGYSAGIDYFAFVEPIQGICDGIRNTLGKHLKQVDQEEEVVLKMVNEAAVWHAFESIRRYYKNQANLF